MVDKSRFASTDSTDAENNNDDSSTSTSHLYFVQGGDPSGRGAGMNHNPEAYELFREGSEGYNAFTKRGSGRKMDWSVSDTLSHIAAAYEPLFDIFGSDPEAYTRVAEATVNAMAASLEGETSRALGLFDPTAEDMIDYALQSDDVDVQDLLEEIKARSDSEDESDE